MVTTDIVFNTTDWKIRLLEKNGKRMKLIVNLQKEEGLAFKNFSDVVKPEAISQEDFLKAIFLTGLSAMQERLTKTIKEYAKENKADLASSGIEVLEDSEGNISLHEAPFSGVPHVQA